MNRELKAWLVPRWALVALGCLAAGCGGGPKPTYPVTGVVRLDGKPVGHRIVGATVLFEPTAPANKGGYSARGLIEKEGRYHLTTFSAGDGAVAGPYRVAVVVHSVYPAGGERAVPLPPPLPYRYISPATSGLEVEVLPQSNRLDLNLQANR